MKDRRSSASCRPPWDGRLQSASAPATSRSSWARRKVDNGTENESDRFPPRRLEAMALEVVREERLSGAPEGGRAAPEVSQGAARERGDRGHHHRTQAGEGRRDHPPGPSGGGDREEGRRGRGAQERA